MPVVDKGKHRVVVGGVLVCLIVSHNHALDLFHIVDLKHLQRALINDVLEAWLVGASVVHHFSVVVALLERSCGVICAHENHAKVGVSEAGVHVEEEISGASG